MEEISETYKCKGLNIRIGNLGIAKAGYIGEEPEYPAWHINKYQKNPHYGHEDEYEWSEDGTYAFKPDQPHWHVNVSCFNSPESCYAIAEFEYNKNEHFYEVNFVSDRPFDIDEEERDVFWELMRIGDIILNKTKNFDFSNKKE